jgi:hypothetical protein
MRGLDRLDYAWPIVDHEGKAAGLNVSLSISRGNLRWRRLRYVVVTILNGRKGKVVFALAKELKGGLL